MNRKWKDQRVAPELFLWIEKYIEQNMSGCLLEYKLNQLNFVLPIGFKNEGKIIHKCQHGSINKKM
jgi:hypothetical protein